MHANTFRAAEISTCKSLTLQLYLVVLLCHLTRSLVHLQGRQLKAFALEAADDLT
jgi:hypothetical protein